MVLDNFTRSAKVKILKTLVFMLYANKIINHSLHMTGKTVNYFNTQIKCSHETAK